MGCGYYCEYKDKDRELTEDEVLHMGRGTISCLEEDVNDRLDGALYGGKSDGIDGLVYSPEEVKTILPIRNSGIGWWMEKSPAIWTLNGKKRNILLGACSCTFAEYSKVLQSITAA